MILPVQPEDLLATFLGCLPLNSDGGSVVGAHLPIAATPRPGSGVRGVGEEGDGIGGSGEVASDRAEDGVEEG